MNVHDASERFFSFLKEGGIDEYEDASEYAPSGCVSFMTIHQSKGLEFPVVVVGSMEATPRKQHTALDALLQQKYYRKPPFEPLARTPNYDFWRLFYTAFSRAQNLLVLTCQEKTRGWRVPSGYLASIYERALPWRDPAFQPERLQLETVKDIDLKVEYSFTSHITVFENCARQYRFYRDLGFAPIRRNPILFGTLVHQTIEDIHKAVLRGEEHIVTDEQIKHWFNANYAHLSRQEHLYLSPGGLDAALDHVLRYEHRERGTWDRLRETEVEVSLIKETARGGGLSHDFYIARFFDAARRTYRWAVLLKESVWRTLNGEPTPCDWNEVPRQWPQPARVMVHHQVLVIVPYDLWKEKILAYHKGGRHDDRSNPKSPGREGI